MGIKNHRSITGGDPHCMTGVAIQHPSIARAQLDVLLTHDAALHAAFHHLPVGKAKKKDHWVFLNANDMGKNIWRNSHDVMMCSHRKHGSWLSFTIYGFLREFPWEIYRAWFDNDGDMTWTNTPAMFFCSKCYRNPDANFHGEHLGSW